MTVTRDSTEVGTTDGVILRDAAGDYYAIPRSALAEFRIAERSRPVVEAFLNGQEIPSYTAGAAGTVGGAGTNGGALGPANGGIETASGGDAESAASRPPSPFFWTARTSRRSNDLWLITV